MSFDLVIYFKLGHEFNPNKGNTSYNFAIEGNLVLGYLYGSMLHIGIKNKETFTPPDINGNKQSSTPVSDKK